MKPYVNENNTILIINEEPMLFRNSFIHTEIGTYLVKLQFKNKLINCEHMFHECKNIIEIIYLNLLLKM